MNNSSSSPSTNPDTKPPLWFWIFAGLALIWFLMDLMAFVMRLKLPEGSMPDAQLELYRSMPSWVNIVYASEVFGGLFGALTLLLRKPIASTLFTVSLAGVLAQTFYIWFLSDAREIMGGAAITMPIVAILIGTGLLLLAKKVVSKSW